MKERLLKVGLLFSATVLLVACGNTDEQVEEQSITEESEYKSEEETETSTDNKEVVSSGNYVLAEPVNRFEFTKYGRIIDYLAGKWITEDNVVALEMGTLFIDYNGKWNILSRNVEVRDLDDEHIQLILEEEQLDFTYNIPSDTITDNVNGVVYSRLIDGSNTGEYIRTIVTGNWVDANDNTLQIGSNRLVINGETVMPSISMTSTFGGTETTITLGNDETEFEFNYDEDTDTLTYDGVNYTRLSDY